MPIAARREFVPGPRTTCRQRLRLYPAALVAESGQPLSPRVYSFGVWVPSRARTWAHLSPRWRQPRASSNPGSTYSASGDAKLKISAGSGFSGWPFILEMKMCLAPCLADVHAGEQTAIEFAGQPLSCAPGDIRSPGCACSGTRIQPAPSLISNAPRHCINGLRMSRKSASKIFRGVGSSD